LHVGIDSGNEVSADDLEPGQCLQPGGHALSEMDVIVRALAGVAENIVSLPNSGEGRLEALKLVTRNCVPEIVESLRELNDGLGMGCCDLRGGCGDITLKHNIRSMCSPAAPYNPASLGKPFLCPRPTYFTAEGDRRSILVPDFSHNLVRLPRGRSSGPAAPVG